MYNIIIWNRLIRLQFYKYLSKIVILKLTNTTLFHIFFFFKVIMEEFLQFLRNNNNVSYLIF